MEKSLATAQRDNEKLVNQVRLDSTHSAMRGAKVVVNVMGRAR